MFCYLALQVGLVYGSWPLVLTGGLCVLVSYTIFLCATDSTLIFYVNSTLIEHSDLSVTSFLIEQSDPAVTPFLIEHSDLSVTSFLIDPVASAYLFMASASYLWVYSHILETNAVHQR